jgi:SAM-dependent methyltransferase
MARESDSPGGKEIHRYWEDRARDSEGKPQATTDDVHLRQLEIATLAGELKKLAPAAGASVVDVGCGDGMSLLAVAEQVPGVTFVGLDYSENMIALARAALARASADLRGRVTFGAGDVLALGNALGTREFDVVLTMRCLINLPTDEQQTAALGQIAAHLKPGGWYFGTENFMGGQNALNAARRGIGLAEIPVRWHNHFFTEERFPAQCAGDFAVAELVNFSSAYYYATRVVYSKLCSVLGEKPDYDHPIHRFAPGLPPMGDFSPIKLIRARRKG